MIELLAPAKINLFLHVVHRRDDGYHELVTRMQKVDLCDRLEISTTDKPGIDFRCSDKDLATPDNLVVTAARMFLKAAENFPFPGISIYLEKHIPVSAGLGGGSSDAGVVLSGLNRLLTTPFSSQELVEMAKAVGADVPFFAVDYTAVVAGGIGERMRPVDDIEGFWILLVNPGITISTRTVFENYALTTVAKNFKLASFRNNESDCFSVKQMHNDLEPVTVTECPVIEKIKESLMKAGAVSAMMSGSGPTTFGLFPTGEFTSEEIQRLVEQFSLVYGHRVYATRTYAGA